MNTQSKGTQRWLRRQPCVGANRRALLTGATGSLGSEIARDLLQLGYELTIAVRNEQAGRRLAQELGNVRVVLLDMNDLASVQRLLDEELSEKKPLALLVNVAGVFRQTGCRSRNGMELHYQTNYFAPMLLTTGLLPLLEKETASKVVTMTSLAAFHAHPDAQDPQALTQRNSIRVYGRSKRLLSCAMQRLAKEHPQVRFSLAHPGISATKLFSVGESGAPKAAFTQGFLRLVTPLMRVLFMRPDRAALSVIEAVVQDAPTDRVAQPRGLFHVWGYPSVGRWPIGDEVERMLEAQLSKTNVSVE